MKKRYFLIILALVVTLEIVLCFAAQPKQVKFYFFEENNCSLDGYLFVGDELVGKTEDGFFNLSYEYYQEEFNTTQDINLFGKLGDCYPEELFFDKSWKSFEIPEYYFLGDSLFKFKTTLSPHNPSRRELIGFIQPSSSEVRSELLSMNLERKDTLEDLSEINKHLNEKVNYTEDWDFNKKENYWQTPEETLNLEQGDCEDFSTALLSLFLAYDPSLNCYNIIFSSHVTTMCHIGDYYIYYDQQKTELRKRISDRNVETKPKLRALKEEYFEHYGINETERAYYAFNEYRFVEFKTDEDFITWKSALNTKKLPLSIFNQLENELQGINITYSEIEEEIIELPTASPQTPTLSGFVSEYFYLLLVFGIILLILVILLIVVIVRR